MARVTVEDCVLQVPNRFELVMLSAHRARALASGAELRVDRDRDKNPVVALREIADQKLDLSMLNESIIKGFQKHIEPDEPEEEEVAELMAGEQQGWINADMDMSVDDAEDMEGEESDELLGEEGEAEAGDALIGDMIGENMGFEDEEIKD